MRRHLVAAFVLLFLPRFAHALPAQHFILESAVPLDAAASAELAAQGIEVQQPLANHRYLVRMRDDAAVPTDARIRSLKAYDASRKIARAAYAEAAQGKAFARLRIVFHQEVTFEEAQRAIDAVGGTIETPLSFAYEHPQRLTVRVPSGAVTGLANDERVFGVYGPPLHPRSLNAVAAMLSHVTPLYSAPYDLTGDGVVLSTFEPDGAPDVAHPEFGGRVISHFAASRPVDSHATHTTGTAVAAGINPSAKGMAPAATQHAFDAGDDFSVVLDTKATQPASFGSVADNNSWDFALSWQQTNASTYEWFGNEDAYGGYSAFESEPYDALSRLAGTPLLVHAAGNDAESGIPRLLTPWSPHKHADDTPAEATHTFCYSQNGKGTDCPVDAPFVCSVGIAYCETTKHATHTAVTTVGLMASTKNSITVGALEPDGVTIASFSSQGPTTDGRIKPEVVAKGVNQFSTFPNNSYFTEQGTSMATPVVTGIAGLLTQQYRRTFGRTPSAAILKTLIIAGADDLGPAGPDYTFGFGLADAKASVDLIIADAGTGSRIRTGAIGNGQDVDIPVTLTATPKFRVVLGWFDPEVLIPPDPDPNNDPLADKTLVNDLDLTVVDPTGATVLPYVLSLSNPTALATRAANHVDTTEEVEIANAIAGTYHVRIHGAIGDARSATQDYVVAMNAGVPCLANYGTLGGLASGKTFTARICSVTDVDTFNFSSNSLSPVSVTVAATDTPLKVTLASSASTTVTQTIAANSSATLNTSINSSASPTPDVQFSIQIQASGSAGATGVYTVTPAYTFTSTPRRPSAKH
ncbi:MAG TPA: S8 family serine peptidase [Thermoanaerobaculia bacterium]|jgi:subtilisin family serine protease|nr:S8 family serine peptidase [Thermoanaerobaculia bacterium]